MALTTTQLLTILLTLLSPSPSFPASELLPAHSQRVIDVRLPTQPSSLAAITLTTKPEKREVLQLEEGSGLVERWAEPHGNIYFSSSYSGSLNTWTLNISDSSSNQSVTNKTLCFDPKIEKLDKSENFVTIVAFSNIGEDQNINVEANWNTNFVIIENSTITTSVTPSSPQMFQFQPSNHYNTETDESYLLTIETEYNDEKCMYVAINEPGCPWHDDIRTVQNSKLWSRMLKTGYFPISAAQFPNSFTVALVSLQNSSDCFSRGVKRAPEEHLKIVNIKVEKTLNSYWTPIFFSMFAILMTSVAFFFVWGGCWHAQLKNNEKRIQHRKRNDKGFRDSCERQRSHLITNGNIELQETLNKQVSENEKSDLMTVAKTKMTPENTLKMNLCKMVEEKSGEDGKARYAINRLLRDELTLQDMSVVIRDCSWHRRQRSKAFLYLVPLLSLFYMIPSAQMVYAEQQRAKATGNLEQCFLNYGCSRPWSIFDDFNHIISNSGYIIYGTIFIILVRLKSKFLPEENRTESDHLGKIGLPQQHSLFYTMGVCMVMQGVFSAIFHVCPSNISLQFDTTMMYVMMILVFIKIYQFRHPDISANAYHCMYAFVVALGMEALSLYIFSTLGKVLFYSVFCLLYTFAILHVAIDSYYYGAIKTSLLQNLPIFMKHSTKNILYCLYPKRFILSIVFVITNFALMIFTVSRSFEEGAKSLSTPILVIFAINVGLFLSYYMIRKIVEIFQNPEGEGTRLRWSMRFFSFIFFLLAVALGMVAMMFYTRRHQSRNSTPPESRNKNELCHVLDFFDNHDMWHFFSATALFLAFIFLLTIDDDLLLTDRDKIEVF
eukprot:TRINITY_DN10504_c0_g1_i5.p1 TRINITY_DN10504_c0_g1~~TRINITY_DN10504_c0_g1_i5.p1  ORF type:complete len:834 (-),score=156.09 TRINITY_DN10504_c0_g1_i5:117-2618(-)